METTVPLQTEKILDADSLFLASRILVEAHRTVRDVQVIVATLLRYALIGVSITDCLMDSMGSIVTEEDQTRDQKA